MRRALTFHVAESESLAPEAVRSAVDIHDRFLSESDPKNPLSGRVRLPYALDNFVNGFQAWLTESIDFRARDVTEVDCATDTVRHMLRFAKPLI